jgi:hypothetical protein
MPGVMSRWVPNSQNSLACPNGSAQPADNYCYAPVVLLIERLEEQMEYGEETWDTDKKPPAKAVIFADPQTAIDGLPTIGYNV